MGMVSDGMGGLIECGCSCSEELRKLTRKYNALNRKHEQLVSRSKYFAKIQIEDGHGWEVICSIGDDIAKGEFYIESGRFPVRLRAIDYDAETD